MKKCMRCIACNWKFLIEEYKGKRNSRQLVWMNSFYKYIENADLKKGILLSSKCLKSKK